MISSLFDESSIHLNLDLLALYQKINK